MAFDDAAMDVPKLLAKTLRAVKITGWDAPLGALGDEMVLICWEPAWMAVKTRIPTI